MLLISPAGEELRLCSPPTAHAVWEAEVGAPKGDCEPAPHTWAGSKKRLGHPSSTSLLARGQVLLLLLCKQRGLPWGKERGHFTRSVVVGGTHMTSFILRQGSRGWAPCAERVKSKLAWADFEVQSNMQPNLLLGQRVALAWHQTPC